MTDGYLTTFADLLAEWKHDPSCSLRTSQDYSLQTVGKLWPESFTDWPTSATTSDGGLFQQPPLVHLIDATDGGDLLILKTPTANLGGPYPTQHPDKRKAGGHGPTLADEVEHLLPTPTASDHVSSGGSTLSNVTLTDAMVRGHGHAPPCSEGTGQRLPDGNASSVDQHQLQLSTDDSRRTSSNG